MTRTNTQKKNILKQSQKPSTKKNPKWFYIILILIPLLFVIILEFSLNFFNYGRNYDEWISLTEKTEILNPDVSYRYFSGIKNIPFSTESFLLKQKPKNSFRVIALGASSGAGYPYQNSASFTKYVRKCLELSYPKISTEVANISMAAVNSYTILDLLPGVLKKQPDLILIYLGHNEYYGALGAGSNQTYGSSRFLTNLILKLNRFKTVELLQNIIAHFVSGLNAASESKDGTLMAKIAGEKLIEINSDVYINGLKQFEGNLRDIFIQCKKAGVPVVIGTLASNVKDIPPFNSIKSKKYPHAKKVYEEAKNKLNNNHLRKADSLYTYAKDLDGLRFRAPESLNVIIKKLASEFHFALANVKEEIKSKSKNKIIGKELMTDHLHPNVEGYQIMGKAFYSEMQKNNYLPNSKAAIQDINKIDSIVRADYNFTKYDSTLADFRIKILKNDWPFIESSKRLPRSKILNTSSIEGQTAIKMLDGKISRQEARLILTDHYLKNKKYDLYAEEILALTDEFPLQNKVCNDAARNLISLKEFILSKKLLLKSYKLEHDGFNSKWLGIINLSQNNFGEAMDYLELSKKFNDKDPQTLFNLSAAYSGIKSYKEAYALINSCLSISPNYANAAQIKKQLEKIINK